MNTVAVTGASGFIGRYLNADLIAAGYARPFYEPNVASIADLVTAAKEVGLRRIVLASTIAVYAPACGLPYRESATPKPINAYALSKLMAEQHLELLTRSGPVSSVALRLAAVYGHGEKGTPALMKFVGLAQARETITLSGNADYRIDQLYVRDATSAMIAALQSDARGSYNIGGGRALPVLEIAQTINEVFGNAGNLELNTDSDAPMPETYMALVRNRFGMAARFMTFIKRRIHPLNGTSRFLIARKSMA